MANAPLVAFSRLIPSGGSTENLAGFALDDKVEGFTGYKGTQYRQLGYPAALTKIAHQITAAGLYPDDGAGTLQSATSSTAVLATGVLQTANANLSPVGMLLVLTSGTGVGQVRRVAGWTSGTRTVTLNRNWTTTPGTGDGYRLLLDTRWANDCHVAAEYSASSNTIDVRFVLFDWALDAAGADRAPLRFWDLAQTLGNAGTQVDTADASYYNGETHSRISRGALGFKLYCTAPTAGAASLWGWAA